MPREKSYITIRNVDLDLKNRLKEIAQKRYQTPLAKFLKQELKKLADKYPPESLTVLIVLAFGWPL